VSQPVLPLLPQGAGSVGPSAGLLEGPDGGVVFVFGLPTFTFAVGDEVGRRLAAVQLVSTEIAAAVEVAAAFGVSTVTLWRWGQDFARDGVAGLVRERTGPRGPIKLTDELAERIRELDGEDLSLRRIAAQTGVSTATVRVALGRVFPRALRTDRPVLALADVPGEARTTNLLRPAPRTPRTPGPRTPGPRTPGPRTPGPRTRRRRPDWRCCRRRWCVARSGRRPGPASSPRRRR
jgi:transposase